MSADPDKNTSETAFSDSDKLKVVSGESGDNSINDEVSPTKAEKTARSVRFPDEDRLVTQYFEPANPWQDVPCTTRAQLAAEYLEACRRHGTPCIDSVLQQIRDLPDSAIGGAARAARLTLTECALLGAAPADALEAVLRKVQFRRLEMDHAAIDDEGAEAMFDMMEYYESANVVSINGPRQFGIRGWQAASRMIKKSAELSELEVSDSPLEASHAPVLARALKPLACRLRALSLQRVALAGEPLLCLVIALKSNSSVRELRLGDNALGAADAAQLASLLRLNTRIQLLDLSNNHIQDAGVGHIADALVEQASQTPPSAAASPLSPHHCLGGGYEARGLAFLVLWNNQLTRNCVVHLSKALRASRSLAVLNVGRNALGGEAARALARGALVSLGLQAARLGPDAAPALRDLVRPDSGLQRLDLRENRLGAAGLQAILSALKDNTTLTQIDLDDPPECTSLSAEEAEGGLLRRLTLDVRALCRRNAAAARRDSDHAHAHAHALHRKISLTCHTACLLRGAPGAEDERRGGRLRSPAPSPAPSPAGSPVPAPHSHSRFSVTPVTPDRECSSDSSAPSPPTRPTYCPSPSRFKVVQVMEPPQIQVHPATTNHSRKTTSRFSVTRNYDSVYNSPPPASPAPGPTRVEVNPTKKDDFLVQGCQQPLTAKTIVECKIENKVVSSQPDTTKSVVADKCVDIPNLQPVASGCVGSKVVECKIEDRTEVFCVPPTTAVVEHKNIDNIESRSSQPEVTEVVTTDEVMECKLEDKSVQVPSLQTDSKEAMVSSSISVVVESKHDSSERLSLQPTATETEVITIKTDLPSSQLNATKTVVVNREDKSVQVSFLQPVTTELVVEQNYDKSIQVPSPQPGTKNMVFEHNTDHIVEACGCQPKTTITDHKNVPIVIRIEPFTTVPVSAPGIGVTTRSVTTQTYDSIAPGTFSKTSQIPVIFEPMVKPKNIPILVTSDVTLTDVNTHTGSTVTLRPTVLTTSVSVQTDKLIISDHDVIVDSIKLVKSDLSYSDVVKNDKYIEKNDNIFQQTNNETKFSIEMEVKKEESIVKHESTVTKIESITRRETIVQIDESTDKTEVTTAEIEKSEPNQEESLVKKEKLNVKNEAYNNPDKDKATTGGKEKLVVKKEESEVKTESTVKKEESITKRETLINIDELTDKSEQTIVERDKLVPNQEESIVNKGESTVKNEASNNPEQKLTMQQIVAITDIIQEIKDLTNKNVKKDNLAPIRDSVLKKNKSESSLDSPDLEVSRLMNKKFISPFDSNSSLEISESSMESLNDKPTIQEPVELDRRRISQLLSNESSVESTSDVTPINSNLLNLSLSSNESVSPIFGKNKKIHGSLSSLEASVSSLESTKQEKIMVTSADSGIEYSLQIPTENKDDNSSNEGTLTNNSSLKETVKKTECYQLLESLTSSPKRTSSLLDMPALKSKGIDRMRKISWVAPSSSFHIPRQEDREVKPSHLEKLLSLFQHPTSIFSRSVSDDEKKCHTPPRKDSSLTSSFWSWGSAVDKERDDDSENTDSTLSERVQVSFVDESFSKKLDSKTPSTDTDNTLSEFQSLPTQECDRVTDTTEDIIVQNFDLSVDKVTLRPNEKVELEVVRPRSFAAVLKSSGSENSLEKQPSPDNGQPVDKLPIKVIRGIKENISPENTLTSSMSNTKALAVELAERQVKNPNTWDAISKNEPKIDEVNSDLAPIATIEETCDENLQIGYIDDKKKDAIDLGKDALSYLIYENQEFADAKKNLAQELKDAEFKEMLDLSPELVIEENLHLPIFSSKDICSRTSPIIPDRAKIKSNSLEDLSQLQTDEKCSPKTKTIAFKVPESTTPRDIPKRPKLRSRSGSSPKSLPENLNKPCPLTKMETILSKKKKKVSSLGKMARDSLLALNMSEEELAEFRKSYKLTSVESLKSLESVSEDANSQSGNSLDSRCKSCLRTSQESLMSLDSITEDCKCNEECGRPGKSGR